MASAINSVDVRDRIRRYIEAAFLKTRPKVTLRDEDWLLRKGIVDSIGAVEIIRFLEDEFAVEIVDDDVTEENLGSVAALTRFVVRKRALAPTSGGDGSTSK